MDMRKEIFTIFVVTGALLIVLGIGESIRRIFPFRPEFSRKSVHFLSGLIALSFPSLIHSHWFVLLLAGGFSSVVLVAKRKGFLKSIHDVERRSFGAVYFPFAVYVLFLLSHDKPLLYFVSILVLAVSDSLAALLGERYGRITYEVAGTKKSLEGSMVFFFSTFLCTHLSLLFMTQTDSLSNVLIAIVIALLVTGFEAISTNGTDNIVIPFCTYYFLGKMLNQPLCFIFKDLCMLLVMVGIMASLLKMTRLFKPSALIAMALVNYAAWALCDFFWLLPLLLSQLMLILVVGYSVHRIAEKVRAQQIKVLLYTFLIPAIMIFATNTIGGRYILYFPYVTSIVAQVAVIFYFFMSIMVHTEVKSTERAEKTKFTMGLLRGFTSLLVIGSALIILSGAQWKSIGLVTTVLGVLLSV